MNLFLCRRNSCPQILGADLMGSHKLIIFTTKPPAPVYRDNTETFGVKFFNLMKKTPVPTY